MRNDIFSKSGAKAIWQDHEEMHNRFVRFQTEFDCTDCKDVSFYICTDTKYELYINGNLAGFGQYDDFPTHKAYTRHDVTEFVKKGNNLVSILAWSAGVDMPSMHLHGLPMVIFAVTEGDKCVLVSSDKVKCDYANAYINGDNIEAMNKERPFNFGFDLRNDDEWKSEKVCDSWAHAVECDDSHIEYYESPVKALKLGELVTGKIFTQGEFTPADDSTTARKMQFAPMAYRLKDDVLEEKDGYLEILRDNVYWISDLGKERTGHYVIDVEAEEGAVIEISIGEHVADMRVRSSMESRNFASQCICRKGRQKMSFYIQRMAGRYLEVFCHKGVKKVYTIGFHEANYPFDFRSTLKLNDRLFNKIYEVSAHTLDMCIHEHYEDCPLREQALFGMDSRNQMLAGYYAFGETAMPRASLSLLAEGRFPCGLLEMNSPGHYERTIPTFSLAWVCAVKEYLYFSGDTDFVKEIFPVVQGVMNFFTCDEKTGLVNRPVGYLTWNMYEWTDGMVNWDDDPTLVYDGPLSAFYSIAMSDYADICDAIGETAEKERAQRVVARIKESFHDIFYCAEEKAYKSYINGDAPHYSQLNQAWALIADLVPEAYVNEIIDAMLSEKYVEISLSHSVYKYDALMKSPEKYAEIMLDDVERQWGYMIYNGATSFWETILGEEDFGGAASLCHGWSATPAYIFWRYIMGLYPEDYGFKTMNPKPVCPKNIEGEGTLKTPQGIFRVKLENGKTSYEKI